MKVSKFGRKIAVYTICKNEENNVREWVENTKAADYVVVGDTGSKDQTISMLEEYGIQVFPLNIEPWRFDMARNQLLDCIPEDTDICISLDFDERLSEGWRDAVEAIWGDDTTKLTYQYLEKLDGNYNLTNSIITSRIHSRKGYHWIYPVHETLQYTLSSQESIAFCPGLEITHTPDRRKDRNGYLKLMECSVEENPQNLIFMHNLGRLYFQNHKFDQCIHVMERILKQPHAAKDLAIASKRYIYRAFAEKKQYDYTREKLLELIAEYPYCSSGYAELCTVAYKNNDFDTIVQLADKIHEIDFSYKSCYNEFANAPSLLYDILSFAYFNKKDYFRALEFAQKAFGLDPQNERLKKNIQKIEIFI